MTGSLAANPFCVESVNANAIPVQPQLTLAIALSVSQGTAVKQVAAAKAVRVARLDCETDGTATLVSLKDGSLAAKTSSKLSSELIDGEALDSSVTKVVELDGFAITAWTPQSEVVAVKYKTSPITEVDGLASLPFPYMRTKSEQSINRQQWLSP